MRPTELRTAESFLVLAFGFVKRCFNSLDINIFDDRFSVQPFNGRLTAFRIIATLAQFSFHS